MATIVVGGTGALGSRLCMRLKDLDHEVVAVYRSEAPPLLGALKDMGCQTQRCDIDEPSALAALVGPEDDIILTPILTTSGPAFRALPRGWSGRAVLFSSANVALDTGCEKYEAIRREEALLARDGRAHAVIRPTMIYGYRGDGNVSRLMAISNRFPIVPVPDYGETRCQPIHIDDLAELTVKTILGEQADDPLLAAGPAPLTMADLMQKIAAAPGRKRLVLPIPITLLRLAARLFPNRIDRAQLDRARQDRINGHVPDIPGWQPLVDIDEGLSRLAQALDGADPPPHMIARPMTAPGGPHVRHPGNPDRD